MAERFVVARGYGKCIEAVAAIDERLSWASTRNEPATFQALLEDRAAWIQLQAVTPRFVHELEVAGG
ncbi:hypothetical protein [Luteimonas fraxinea]|uniref:Uncharacterized protein n=1 Tax=Luteimonas fraxinea TaxID=2901869 RepID=A0ABS8UC24_9GAMM|nr:hypothetical protein [Luteimonas fraxinea]MCD9096532.1 hypothetical protein [Luteimonas fraxinea]